MVSAWAALLLLAGPLPAQDSSCAACHAKEKSRPALAHDFDDWKRSRHARAGVSCADCHGGRPSEPAKAAAHQGLRPSTDPESLVYFTRIPETCGACHVEELASFKKSAHHQELMRSGRGPNCATCHGSMAISVIGPRDMEQTCRLCHRAPTRAHAARLAQERARASLRRLEAGLARARSRPGLDLAAEERSYRELSSRFHEILVAWHGFDAGRVEEDSNELARSASAAFARLSARTKEP